MIVVIKTFYWFLVVGKRFSSTILFLMIVARCPDKLFCLSYCEVITIIYSVPLAPTIIRGLKFLGLRRHYVRPYFNDPKQPESHYAAILNNY